jgi:hypothetical protein
MGNKSLLEIRDEILALAQWRKMIFKWWIAEDIKYSDLYLQPISEITDKISALFRELPEEARIDLNGFFNRKD